MSPVKAKMRLGQRSHTATRGPCRSIGRLTGDRSTKPTAISGVSQRWECHAFNLNLHVERVKLWTPDAGFPSMKVGTA